MGWGFSIFYSRKNKLFSASEQSFIDKTCRGLKEFTKKKYDINFHIEENRNYGSYNSETHSSDLVTQSMNYTFWFSDKYFVIEISKIWATDKKQSEELLEVGAETWDYRFDYDCKINGQKNNLPKSFDLKKINGLRIYARSFKKNPRKKLKLISLAKHNLINEHILINYNKKWKDQFKKKIKGIFSDISKNVKQ